MAAVGVNLQRFGKRRGLPKVSMLGLALAMLVGLADMASFQFAPQSLLAPFASLGLVVNLFLAPMHGESIAPMDIVCTMLVVAGVALCLASSTSELPPRTPNELGALAMRPAFLGWVAIEAAALATAALRARTGAVDSTLTAASWAIAAGLGGGCTVLFAKLLTECVKASAPTWALLGTGLGTATSALCQVVTLNVAVGKYTPLFIVPLFTATSLVWRVSSNLRSHKIVK